MSLIYYLLHYILGLIIGVIFTGMIYPPLRILPSTIVLISQKKIKKSALIPLFFSFGFWCFVIMVTLFGASYLTPIITLLLNIGFIFGFLSVIIFGWLTPSTNIALQQDYASFFSKYLNTPEDVSQIHLNAAKSIIDWFNDSSNEAKEEDMQYQLENLIFSSDDEISTISALRFLDADSDIIHFATEMMGLQRQYKQAQMESEESDRQRIELQKKLEESEIKLSKADKDVQEAENYMSEVKIKKEEALHELEDMVKGWFDESEKNKSSKS